MKSYPLHECFHTFQGEGVHMGIPAFFIRLFGCPVHCPWCDSAGTWHKDWVPENIPKVRGDELANSAKASGAPIVVITGGEPAVHDLSFLIDECQKRRIRVHLETSGGFPIHGSPDWITLSPKKWRRPINGTLEKASEFKIIVEEPEDIPLYSSMIGMGVRGHYPYVWLHPEWSKREDQAVLRAISEAVKKGNGDYRAGYQIHKLYNVDRLDVRSMPLVPLGGDVKKGF